jgi:hypothetical protein
MLLVLVMHVLAGRAGEKCDNGASGTRGPNVR